MYWHRVIDLDFYPDINKYMLILFDLYTAAWSGEY